LKAIFAAALIDTPARQARRALKLQAKIDRVAARSCGSRGELRGWQLKSSGGICVWQFVRGGRFQPVQGKRRQVNNVERLLGVNQ
jgi:hypothetical protein